MVTEAERKTSLVGHRKEGPLFFTRTWHTHLLAVCSTRDEHTYVHGTDKTARGREFRRLFPGSLSPFLVQI